MIVGCFKTAGCMYTNHNTRVVWSGVQWRRFGVMNGAILMNVCILMADSVYTKVSETTNPYGCVGSSKN